jgi:hypothetical protein
VVGWKWRRVREGHCMHESTVIGWALGTKSTRAYI